LPDTNLLLAGTRRRGVVGYDFMPVHPANTPAGWCRVSRGEIGIGPGR
jgi:hypothetical protein